MLIVVLTTYSLYTPEAQAIGSWNEESAKLTLLVDTPIYDQHSSDYEPIGAISAFQSVQVIETYGSEQDSPTSSQGSWYLVKTWLGEKWLRKAPAVVKGDYYPVSMEVSFTGIEDIYDLPADDEKNGGKLSPPNCNGGRPAFFLL